MSELEIGMKISELEARIAVMEDAWRQVVDAQGEGAPGPTAETKPKKKERVVE